MTNEKILEGNKLIAEFMGGSACTLTIKSIGEVDGFAFEFGALPIDELQYNSEWGLLMDVVEKISNDFTINIHSFPENGFNTIIKEGNFRRGYGESDKAIESVWKAVVDFIKYYNQNKS